MIAYAHPSRIAAGAPYRATQAERGTAEKQPGPPGEPPRVLVTGSRTWRDAAAVRVALTATWRDAGQPIVVVHGGCPTGADAIADAWAREHAHCGITVERHVADWRRHGRAAGPVRNQAMVDLGALVVLAFPAVAEPSPGTRDCVRRALRCGLPVRYPATDDVTAGEQPTRR